MPPGVDPSRSASSRPVAGDLQPAPPHFQTSSLASGQGAAKGKGFAADGSTENGKGWLGGKASGVHVPYAESCDSPSSVDSCDLGRLLDEQEILFWASENESRLRNAEMTPKEKSDMEEKKQDKRYQKVLTHFGQVQANKSAKDLLQALQLETPLVPGQMCSMRSPQFTILKHLVQAGINTDCEGIQVHGRPRCYCFPKTSLMPQGCIHTQKPLWSMNFWPLTLCPTCSTCAKCHRPLRLQLGQEKPGGSKDHCMSALQRSFLLAFSDNYSLQAASLCHNFLGIAHVVAPSLRLCKKAWQEKGVTDPSVTLCYCTADGAHGAWGH